MLTVLAACGGGGGGGEGGGGGGGGGGGALATLTPDFYPLNVGDTRSWRVTQGSEVGSLRTERVTALGAVGSVQAYTVVAIETGSSGAGTGSAPAETEYLTSGAAGISSVPGPASTALAQAVGAVDMLRFGMTEGQTLVLVDRSFNIDANGDGRIDTIDLRVQSSFVGLEAISTAAGSFPGSARVRSAVRTTVRLAGAPASTVDSVVEEWLAPGVGPVRSSVTVGTGSTATVDVEEVTAYGVAGRRSESVAPVLVSGTPAANASVASNVQPVLVFSELLDPVSLDGPNGLTIVNAAGQAVAVTRSLDQGGVRITLQPAGLLQDGRYELRLGSGITDLAGNPLPAAVRAFSVDTTGPRRVSSVPAEGAEDAPLTGTLTLSFDEPVFAAPGSPLRFELADLVLGTSTFLAGTIDGTNLRAVLDTPLARNRSYALILRSQVTDASGNAVDFGNGRLNFRTDPGPLSRPAALEAGAVVYALTQGDVDADGRSDLVYAAQTSGTNSFYVAARLQQADGRYAAPSRLAALPSTGLCSPDSLVLGHADGDGRIDIALAGCSAVVTSSLTVLRQTAAGRFETESPPVSVISRRIAAADVDGDGRAEIIVAEPLPGGTRLSALRRNDAGAWVSVLSIDGGTTVVSDLAFADLDGDGRRDAVWLRLLPNNRDWELAWALRQGAGFASTRSLALATGLSDAPGLSLGDVNGDGRNDVLLLQAVVPPGTGTRRGELRVLRNDGSGSFVAAQTLSFISPATAATVADIDGDNRNDVVLALSSELRVAVLLQGADGNLQAERFFDVSQDRFLSGDALAVLDLNADGRRDLVAGSSVLLGRPTTGPWPLAEAGEGTARVAAASSPGSALASAPVAQASPVTRALAGHLRALQGR